MEKILFIDRDGTLIKEAPPSYQVDSFDKLEFYPHMFEFMTKISRECNYKLIMISNQDGMGTSSFPEETFWLIQNFVMKSMECTRFIFSIRSVNASVTFNTFNFGGTRDLERFLISSIAFIIKLLLSLILVSRSFSSPIAQSI